MSAEPSIAGTDERAATAIEPMPLARYDPDARQQGWLDRDPYYRWLVLAAVTVAFAAGTGFGTLAREAGWLATMLWAVTGAGLAARLAAPRGGLRRGAGDASALKETLRLIALLTVAYAALAAARSGVGAIAPIGAAAGVAMVMWLAALRFPWVSHLVVLVAVVGGAALPVHAIRPDGVVLTVLIGCSGAVAGALIAFTAWARKGIVNPAVALTRVCGFGWAFLTWGASLQEWTAGLAFISACLALLLLEFFIISRRYFVPTVLAVAAVQLAALPPGSGVLHAPLWPQLLAATIEYGLLAFAGLIHAGSQVERLATATYRISPLCIVPRLDRAWDHPVKINVA